MKSQDGADDKAWEKRGFKAMEAAAANALGSAEGGDIAEVRIVYE